MRSHYAIATTEELSHGSEGSSITVSAYLVSIDDDSVTGGDMSGKGAAY